MKVEVNSKVELKKVKVKIRFKKLKTWELVLVDKTNK